MKKLFAAITPAVSFLTLVPSAFAATTLNTCASSGQFTALCNLTSSGFGTLIGTLLQLFFVLAIVAALLFLVWGGFKWITSGGDKGKVTEAREHIVAAIIGLVVVFLAFFIINILIGFFLPGQNINTIVLPTI